MDSSKILLGFGLMLLFSSGAWLFFAVPELEALPSDYNFGTELLHPENNRFEIGGNWSGDQRVIATSGEEVVRAYGGHADAQTSFKIESHSGELLFGLNQTFRVDRRTRHNLPWGTDKEGEAYFAFPPRTEKVSYRWWPSTLGQSAAMDFVDEDEIQGLKVYQFRSSGISDDTDGYGFLPLVPERYRALSNFTLTVWVEPATGTVVNYIDRGTSYYAEKETGARAWDISEWGNRYSPGVISHQAASARELAGKYALYERTIPAGLAIAGLALSMVSFAMRKKDEPEI